MWTWKIGIETRHQILQKPLAPNYNSGKKRSISRDYPTVWTSGATSLRDKIRGKITWGDLASRRMRSPKQCRIWQNKFWQAQAFRTKLRSTIVLKFGFAGTLFDKTRGVRIRSRFRSINAHDEQKRIMLRRDGHSEKVQNPTVVLTANGEVHTHEEAQVFVHDLNQFVDVQLLEETPAVLSPGNLRKSHGWPKMGRVLSARRTVLKPLVTVISIPKAVRLLQRHPKNRWDQSHLPSLWQLQQAHLRFCIRAKWRTTRKHFSRLGFGTSYKKWQRNRGSTVSSLTSQKTGIATSAWEPK